MFSGSRILHSRIARGNLSDASLLVVSSSSQEPSVASWCNIRRYARTKIQEVMFKVAIPP